MSLLADFQKALSKRQFHSASVLRVFHGPGEGSGEASKLSLDKFGPHLWASLESESCSETLKKELIEVAHKFDYQSLALITRHRKGMETSPCEILIGTEVEGAVVENCELKFEINFKNQRQPGLFLDMDFARQWLKRQSSDLAVLNLFSYTGSLSVAAGAGQAKKVTSVDLSKSYTEWGLRNWRLNELPDEKADFLYGDSFDWLKRFQKQSRQFDLVICDPPSFSRSKSGTFSTANDLIQLHQSIFTVLKPGGCVVTSINSEKIPRKKFESDIFEAARLLGRKIVVDQSFGLPLEFPVKNPEDSYLKGLIIRDMTKS